MTICRCDMALAQLRARLLRCLVFAAVFTAAAQLVCSVGNCADYVIHISVDGLGAPYLQAMIDAGRAPNFKRFAVSVNAFE